MEELRRVRTSGTVTHERITFERRIEQPYDSSNNIDKKIEDLGEMVDTLRWEVGTLKDRFDELERERVLTCKF
ncbi:MAG: hypothetical protein QMD80_01780 [archaeon]|nr:hypothetical protein [archaeon]